MHIKIISLLSLSLMLSGCFSSKLKTPNLALKYSSDSGPTLDIKEYLNNNLKGFGVAQDTKSGLVTKRFTSKVSGSWEGDKGVIKRQFNFADDTKDSRTWLITLDGNNFSGVGHNIDGTALGQQYKGLAQIVYKAKMPFNSNKDIQNVTETIYNIDNKSSMHILEFGSQKVILSLYKAKKKDKPFKSKAVDIAPIKEQTPAE